jgi:hypothetical protein
LSDNSGTFINILKTNTLKPNNLHKASLLKDWEKRGLVNVYKSNQAEPNSRMPKSLEHDMFDFVNLTSSAYKKQKLATLNLKYNLSTKHLNLNSKLNTSLALVNINFLRKERLYTKLKYSRSPAYDIVSGGAAALLAGFIGFLISEKFGYELVDSGDFYYAFMYAVFLIFSLKPLLTVSDSKKGFVQMISLKPLLIFYSILTKLVLMRFK